MDNNIKMNANEIRGVRSLDSFGSRQGLSGYCSVNDNKIFSILFV